MQLQRKRAQPVTVSGPCISLLGLGVFCDSPGRCSDDKGHPCCLGDRKHPALGAAQHGAEA